MFKKIPKGVWIALKGIAHGMSKETNMIVQFFVAIIVIAFSVIIKIPTIQLVIIISVCFFVIIIELINTSIEHLIDRIHPTHDKQYGKVKDMMAGAVLLAVLLSIIVGVFILGKPFITLFS